MSWLEHHRLSEELASDAEVAARRGEHSRALGLYAKAAQAEELASRKWKLPCHAPTASPP